MENQFEGQYSWDAENDEIRISARVVTKDLVDHIFESYYPDAIYFEDSVEEFGNYAFQNANLGVVELSSAKNVTKLGVSCFELAFNIDAHGAFVNVELIGNSCFKNSIVLSDLEMPKLEIIPAYAFWNVDAFKISLPLATSKSETAFKYASSEAGIEIGYLSNIMENAILL